MTTYSTSKQQDLDQLDKLIEACEKLTDGSVTNAGEAMTLAASAMGRFGAARDTTYGELMVQVLKDWSSHPTGAAAFALGTLKGIRRFHEAFGESYDHEL